MPSSNPSDPFADIEPIERATLQAVAPRRIERLGDWLVPLDEGPIGRARSAVPLRHHDVDVAALPVIEELYRGHGLPPAFRIADSAGLRPVEERLAAGGLRAQQPTLVQIGELATMRSVTDGEPAEVSAAPDEGWAQVFLGEGFDPVDGAGRVAALSRAQNTFYASVRQQGATVAVGALAIGFGWASVHGMRTVAGQRGRGLAGRVLAGIAQAALERGVQRVFLQVEEANGAARSLYRRAGFATVWRYRYWRP